MNIRIEQKNNTTPKREEILRLAKATGLNEKLVELLALRNILDESSINKFLYASADNLYDPFLMKGMSQTVARLNEAIENDETIVIYGDYDADGVCAAAILSLYLSSRGLDVFVHIPNRTSDGYGLNVDSLAKIIESKMPALILTCDCGISGVNEVEFVQDLGVDIIVTDHHELSGKVPNCVVVNPKQTDCDYPDKMLCGAGVALKVVEALAGRNEALNFIDIATVATIADLVPLLDENRLIVQLGLKRLNERKNLGLSVLFNSLGLDRVDSSDVAFKVAPRINAAGRMGDAFRAFELLTSSDVKRVKEIVDELSLDNVDRKKLCDEIYFEAEGDLAFEDLINNRAIILSHPNWEKGITGIVAARLSGEYCRPAFILVRSGDTYKGTCRSVDGINIHELLSYCRDLLIEFGGHAQAAGFSILPENIDAFKVKVNEYLSKFSDEYFLPKASYDMELSEDEIDYDFVQSLTMLEPTGNGNPKPLFKLDVTTTKIAPCKSSSAHISVTLPSGLQIFAFNYAKQSYQLLGNGNKSLVVELQTNNYGGKQVKGIMRCCCPQTLYVPETLTDSYYYGLLKFLPDDSAKFEFYSDDDFEKLSSNLYGTLLISPDFATYKQYCDRRNAPFFHEYAFTTNRNNFTRIMVAPDLENDNLSLSSYETVVFLTAPLNTGVVSYLNKKIKGKVYLPASATEKYKVSCDRDVFAKYFAVLREGASLNVSSLNGLFRTLSRKNDINYKQFLFCVQVFNELGFISVVNSPFSLVVNRDVRADLSSSKLYSYVKERV